MDGNIHHSSQYRSTHSSTDGETISLMLERITRSNKSTLKDDARSTNDNRRDSSTIANVIEQLSTLSTKPKANPRNESLTYDRTSLSNSINSHSSLDSYVNSVNEAIYVDVNSKEDNPPTLIPISQLNLDIVSSKKESNKHELDSGLLTEPLNNSYHFDKSSQKKFKKNVFKLFKLKGSSLKPPYIAPAAEPKDHNSFEIKKLENDIKLLSDNNNALPMEKTVKNKTNSTKLNIITTSEFHLDTLECDVSYNSLENTPCKLSPSTTLKINSRPQTPPSPNNIHSNPHLSSLSSIQLSSICAALIMELHHRRNVQHISSIDPLTDLLVKSKDLTGTIALSRHMIPDLSKSNNNSVSENSSIFNNSLLKRKQHRKEKIVDFSVGKPYSINEKNINSNTSMVDSMCNKLSKFDIDQLNKLAIDIETEVSTRYPDLQLTAHNKKQREENTKRLDEESSIQTEVIVEDLGIVAIKNTGQFPDNLKNQEFDVNTDSNQNFENQFSNIDISSPYFVTSKRTNSQSMRENDKKEIVKNVVKGNYVFSDSKKTYYDILDLYDDESEKLLTFSENLFTMNNKYNKFANISSISNEGKSFYLNTELATINENELNTVENSENNNILEELIKFNYSYDNEFFEIDSDIDFINKDCNNVEVPVLEHDLNTRKSNEIPCRRLSKMTINSDKRSIVAHPGMTKINSENLSNILCLRKANIVEPDNRNSFDTEAIDENFNYLDDVFSYALVEKDSDYVEQTRPTKSNRRQHMTQINLNL